MQKSDLVTFRDHEPDDFDFIYTTWIKGYMGGHKWFRKVAWKTFWKNYEKVITHILENHEVKVCCLKSDHSTILGYCVFKDHRVDWIHVKENWRRIGIARDLLPKDFKSVSHLTNVAYEILFTQKKIPNITYNPFL